MNETEKMMKLALEAAREAGEYIADHLGKIKEMSYKTGINDPVTDVDKSAEAIITGKIHRAFPEHSVLAEEGGSRDEDGSDVTWIIDPLDGTVNYAHTFPFFCVSIGVKRTEEMVLGVVYDPVRDEMFHAILGGGAFLNGESIFVSSASEVKSSLVATGFAYDAEKKEANTGLFVKMIPKARGVRRPGAAALDLCYVAAGRLDGFWELNLSPWDTAAGQLLVTEAGGRVSTINGSKYDVFKNDILATNGRIHNEMSSILLAG